MTIEILLGLALLLPFLLLGGYAIWHWFRSRVAVTSQEIDDDQFAEAIENARAAYAILRDTARIELHVRCGLIGDQWVEVKPSEVLIGEHLVARRCGSVRDLDTLPLWMAWSVENGNLVMRRVNADQPLSASPTTSCTASTLCGA